MTTRTISVHGVTWYYADRVFQCPVCDSRVWRVWCVERDEADTVRGWSFCPSCMKTFDAQDERVPNSKEWTLLDRERLAARIKQGFRQVPGKEKRVVTRQGIG